MLELLSRFAHARMHERTCHNHTHMPRSRAPPASRPSAYPLGRSASQVCTLSEMCANSAELFRLNVGDPFYCDFDAAKYDDMQKALRQWD